MKRTIYLSCICMALCLCLVGCKKNNDKTAYDEKNLREIQINLVANAYEKNPIPTDCTHHCGGCHGW